MIKSPIHLAGYPATITLGIIIGYILCAQGAVKSGSISFSLIGSLVVITLLIIGALVGIYNAAQKKAEKEKTKS